MIWMFLAGMGAGIVATLCTLLSLEVLAYVWHYERTGRAGGRLI